MTDLFQFLLTVLIAAGCLAGFVFIVGLAGYAGNM